MEKVKCRCRDWRIFDWRFWLGIKPRFAKQLPKKKYTISVIIPAYNEEQSIEETIQSIKEQTVPVDEIIVVDDCSSDKTGEIAFQMGVTVVRTEKNQGSKAMAQNFVIPQIGTDLIATIDADTTLAPDAIERTLSWFNDSMTASVCGFSIPRKIKTVWERGRLIDYFFGLIIFKGAQNNTGLVMVSSGCFSVIRTELIHKMGGFDPKTIAEDMDLTWKFILGGYGVYCDQCACCYPIEPPTLKIFINQVDRWYRGLFQNISIHSFRKNKWLGIYVYGNLVDSALALAISIFFLIFFIENVLKTFFVIMAINLIIVAIPCLIKGWSMGMVSKVFTSLPFYFLVRIVTIWIFWRSFWREWIIKDKCVLWNK